MIKEVQKATPGKATGQKELMIGFKFRKNQWSESVVPEIRLNGKWLESLGFKMGSKVKVEFKAGKIVLTP